MALSGGQRRRPALARALLADFDESTEHLDDATVAVLTRDLLAAGSRAVVLITHRTDDLHGVDTVISLGRNAVAAAAV
jgi:ATP-binding cassette subfamily C protein CydC